MLFKLLVLLIVLGIVLVYFVVMVRSYSSLGSINSFECGLDRIVNNGFFVSLRFFIVSLLFLLIDLELVLMIFSPIVIFNELVSVIKFSFIIWVFVLGTIWEWWVGTIDWSL